MTMFFLPLLISSHLSSLALSFPLFLVFYSSLFTPHFSFLIFPPIFFLLFLCPSHFSSSFVFSFLVSLFLPTQTSHFLSFLLLDCFFFFPPHFFNLPSVTLLATSHIKGKGVLYFQLVAFW